MVAWDAGLTLADRFRRHAGDAQHLYGHLMRSMAQDWEAGGPVRQVCAGYEHAPSGSALQLRLLAGVFRLVLQGRAPELVPYYPCLGGDRPPDGAWPVVRPVIADHVEVLRDALEVAPQTNEIGRSAALLSGLFDLVARSGVRRIRLLELGASAGLNLLVDHIGFAGPGWRWGDSGSPLRLEDAIQGPVVPQELAVVQRRGCDLAPADPRTAEGRQLLTSFVWPFDLHRHARLRAALQVAAAHPVTVDAAAASAWLPVQLAEAPDDRAVLTVVWHSITQLYWPPAELVAVEDALAAHGAHHRLARVGMEYEGEESPTGPVRQPVLRTWLWEPGRTSRPDVRVLGTAHEHGIPVRLRPSPP